MHDISLLDSYFNKYISNILRSSDLLVRVDLPLLHQLKLFNFYQKKPREPSLTRYFHVVESLEKITLVNEEFVIWIMPEKIQGNSVTYVLIALNHQEKPTLEVAFYTTGVYNTSRLILSVLEKFLQEIEENEELINKFKKAS